MPIITSLLDSDFYKFSMSQVVWRRFPDAMVEYTFKCRNPGVDLIPYANQIRDEISLLGNLSLDDNEVEYLNSLGWFKPGFLLYLKMLRLSPQDDVFVDATKQNLEITIAGPWSTTIFYEVPVLAIINEIYFRDKQTAATTYQANKRLEEKIELIRQIKQPHNFKFSDFGTRRRFSKDFQDYALQTIIDVLPPETFTGTSNVYFARKLDIRPIGTMAHEFIQACQAFVRLADSQKFAFQTWAEEYRGDLGIALSDTLGMDVFLRDFDKYFAKLFDGARHDSGDPYVWCDKLIKHYQELKIDPMTKTAVFSDGLTFPKAIELYDRYKGRINTVFGIGTNLTNDTGLKPLQIVIKMTKCNGKDVAKLSDDPGKQMCRNENYLEYIRSVISSK